MSDASETYAGAEIVVNPYQTADSKLRKGLQISGPWRDAYESLIKSERITALYLNTGRGWKSGDYGFLAHLNTIEELVISARESSGLEAIEKMSSLVDFSVTTNTKTEIDFSKLTNLKKCFLNWWPGALSIFNCETLEDLYIDSIRLKAWKDVKLPPKLIKLTIGNSNIDDLSVVSELASLKWLELLNCRKLTDFTALSKLTDLQRLRVDGSKGMKNLEFVSSLQALELLNVSDSADIESLRPLADLKSLRAVAFAGTKTNIEDGDLSVLTTLPRLAMLMFAPRKHYSHKLIKQWDWENFEHPDVLLEKK